MKRIAAIVCGAFIFGSAGAALAVQGDDDFQCWKAKDQKTPQFAKQSHTVQDAFSGGPVVTDLKKPFLLCAAAAVDGVGPVDANERLSCYKVKGAKLAAGLNVTVTDQFWPVGVVQIKKAFVVCDGQATSVP